MLYYICKKKVDCEILKRGAVMEHRIFTLSFNAITEEMDWVDAICEGEIETVAEFDTYAEAVQAFEDSNYDPELYGVE